MSFLSLFALMGLGLASLPILFHLKRQRVKERQNISTLMFLKPTKVSQKQSRKMENWLLLLLRLLALICIVLAFARPVWLGDLILERGLERTMVTWVVDLSASMNREQVLKELDVKLEKEWTSLQENDFFELMTFGDHAKVVISYEQWETRPEGTRLAFLKEQLLGLKPGDGAGEMKDALLLAEQRQSQNWSELSDFEKLSKRKLVVFSDLTQNQSLEGLEHFQQKEEVELFFHPLKLEASNNAKPYLVHEGDASAAPKWGVDYIHGKETMPFTLKLMVDGQLKATKKVDLAPKTRQAFVWPSEVAYELGRGYQLSLEGDAEDFDNVVYHFAQKQDRLTVLHFHPNENQGPESHRFFMEMGMKSDANLKIDYRERLDGLSDQVRPFVIIERAMSADELSYVKSHLSQSGAVLVLLNGASDLTQLKALSGVDYGMKARRSAQGEGLANLDIKHKLFKPFADPRFRDFSALYFWEYVSLNHDETERVRTLAEFESGAPFLQEVLLKEGQLWLMASGWAKQKSNFARSSKFLPFLFNMMEVSSARQRFSNSYDVGERMASPIGREALSVVSLLEEAKKADVEHLTEQKGLFILKSHDQTFDYAVNIEDRESQTQPLDGARRDYLFSLNSKKEVQEEGQKEEGREIQFLSELEHQQKLWQSFLIAALVFIVLETLLAATHSKPEQDLA